MTAAQVATIKLKRVWDRYKAFSFKALKGTALVIKWTAIVALVICVGPFILFFAFLDSI